LYSSVNMPAALDLVTKPGRLTIAGIDMDHCKIIMRMHNLSQRAKR